MVISAIAWAADAVGAFAASKSGVGARALAMGGAFVAIANNATAMHWNPAGLAQVNDTRLTGMTTDLSGSGWITHNVLAATTMFSNIGIGLGWDSVNISYVDSDCRLERKQLPGMSRLLLARWQWALRRASMRALT